MKDPDIIHPLNDHTIIRVANACTRIRKGIGTRGDWAYLYKHASKELLHAMIREVCLVQAGIDPYPRHKNWQNEDLCEDLKS